MENFGNQNIEQDSYKTGSTKPPKNRGGLVAGLLVAVILLAGVSSILGVMNIQLFRMLQAEKGSPVSFEENTPTETKATVPGSSQNAAGKPALGLTVSSLSELDQRYFHLPAGVLVSQVEEQGCAAKAGLAVGDIIVSFNGVSVLTAEELEQALQACQIEEQVEVVFYRYRTEKQHRATVILDDNG
ncbi:MAG: PDZ domain-containing protein [Oscillospiraceae bacterium]|nr:PDZ domain-containing protein [Oscillospiraceae bacterium]